MGAHLLDHSFEVGGTRGLHVQERVGFTGDGVGLDDVRQPRDHLGDVGRVRAAPAVELYEGLGGGTDRLVVEAGGEAGDDPVGDQAVDPPFHGRRRQADPAPDRPVGSTRIRDQFCNDLPI